jgi:DNA gyrase subunit A
MAENIQTVSISKETHERYLRYAVSVITSRALPDVRDGLKPVQRRILYTMYNDLGLDSNAKPRKCAKIVGDVTGNYHPHGTVAAYEALVRMAQDWIMRVPIVHGHGNFGSVDGDKPAAERYTEANLWPVATDMMSELKQNTVEMRPNYDNTGREPVILPVQFPNILVNGSSGIAVGMATNMPPHNMNEVLRSAIALIDDPEASTAELMNRGVKGPDFPLGAKIVTDRSTLRKIYEDGDGTIKLQAEWKVEGADSKSPTIVITSLPYGCDKEKLENDIGEIIDNRRVPGLLSQVNETNKKDGLRMVLDIKPGTDPTLVMAYLYKHTGLQANFSFNMTCLVPANDGSVKPERLGLKAILRYFLDFRYVTIKRRFEYELAVLKKRIHLLEGFQIIFNALDRAIRMIRESTGKADAAEKLIKAFALDDDQTNAILDSQLYKIAQMEIRKILDELEEKKKAADKIEAILKSERKLWGVVKDELGALAEKYGQRRITRMAGDEDVLEFNEDAYITKENTNVVITKDGWLKRVGRLASVEGTRVREGDEVTAVVPASTLDTVIFFADDGTAYSMRVNEVPASSGYGEPIQKFFKLGDNVRIIGVETSDERFTPKDVKGAKDDPAGPYVLAVTSGGYTVRTPLEPYRVESTKSGRRYIRLPDGEKVVYAATVLKDPKIEESLFIATREGYVIHFKVDEISVLSGAGRGVIGIKVQEKDECIGAGLIGGRFDKFDLETTGGITRQFGGAVPTVGRGGSGKQEIKRTQFTKVIRQPIALTNWDDYEEKPTGPKSK